MKKHEMLKAASEGWIIGIGGACVTFLLMRLGVWILKKFED